MILNRIIKGPFIGSFILACFVILLAVSMVPPVLKPVFLQHENKPDFAFEGVKVSQVLKGVKEWTLYAESATLDKGKGLTLFHQLKGSVFNKDKLFLEFNSPEARFQHFRNRLELNDVLARYYFHGGQGVFESDELIWQAKKGSFTGRGNVVINTDSVRITSHKIVFSTNNQRLHITGKPVAIITL